MHLGRGLVWAALVALATACGPRTSRDGADAGAAAIATVPTPDAPAPIPSAETCVGGAASCSRDDAGEACVAGRRTRVTCGGGTTCVGGACIAAKSDPWREVFSAIGPGGFVNRWAARQNVRLRDVEALEQGLAMSALEPGSAVTPACASSALVPAPRRATDAGATFTIFSGTLLTGRAGDLDVDMSAQGHAKLEIDGKVILDLARDAASPPMLDEDHARAKLTLGEHRVVVTVDQAARADAAFYLRLRGVPALFAADKATRATCSDAELADVTLTPRPIAGGFAVTVKVDPKGLVPRNGAKTSLALEVLTPRRGGGKDAAQLEAIDVGPEGVTRVVDVPMKGPAAWLRATFGGATPTEQPLVYRRELSERAVRLAGGIPKLAASKIPEGTKATTAWLTQSLLDAIAKNDIDTTWLERRADRAERLLAGALAGKDELAAETGVVERAYRSRLDGTLQPYLVAVPRDYPKPGRQYPLILAMHGLNGEPGQALRTVVGEAPERDKMNVPWEARHLPFISAYGSLIVAPTGRGNAGQRLTGEADVLRVVEEMKAAYAVDAARVSITGYSLGGTVSFVVPLHHPDVFSAAAPLCGYPNFSEWSGVRDVPKTPWEDVLVARKSIVHYAENGEHLPLHMVHGGQDGPQRSKMMADRYQELGYRRIFDLQDDLDHDVWEYAYEKGRMIGWLRVQKRPLAPARVRFVTGETRYDTSSWVKVLGLADDTKFASVDARWDAGRGVVDLTADNVSALALDLKLAGATGGVRVTTLGRDLGEAKGDTAWISFGGAPKLLGEAPDLRGRKRHGVSGPLDDVQLHRAVVVYGTLIPAEIEANRLAAEVAATARGSTLRFPIVADTALDDAAMKRTSLILVGRPATNRVTAALASALGLVFEPDAVTVRGKRYAGADVGVSIIRPNPGNPDEYVVVHAGVTSSGTLASRHLPWLVPDYLVYDARITALRGALLLGAAPVLDGGFFDASWR